MNFDTVIIIFVIASLVLGFTFLALWDSFGPDSRILIDPFEEGDS